jgi:hypothetical protein
MELPNISQIKKVIPGLDGITGWLRVLKIRG